MIGNKTYTIVWQREIIKNLSNNELRNPNRKLKNKNTCSNILKTEMLRYKRENIIFLNMFLNLRSKHIIKSAIAQIKKKKVTLYANQFPRKTPT